MSNKTSLPMLKVVRVTLEELEQLLHTLNVCSSLQSEEDFKKNRNTSLILCTQLVKKLIREASNDR